MNIYEHDIMGLLGCDGSAAKAIFEHIDPALNLAEADEAQFFAAVMHAKRQVNLEAGFDYRGRHVD